MRIYYALLTSLDPVVEVTDPTYERVLEEIEFRNLPPHSQGLTAAQRDALVEVCEVFNPNPVYWPFLSHTHELQGIALYSSTTGQWIRSIPLPQSMFVDPVQQVSSSPGMLVFPEVIA